MHSIAQICKKLQIPKSSRSRYISEFLKMEGITGNKQIIPASNRPTWTFTDGEYKIIMARYPNGHIRKNRVKKKKPKQYFPREVRACDPKPSKVNGNRAKGLYMMINDWDMVNAFQ